MFNKHLAASAKLKKHAIDKFAEKGKKIQKLFRNTPSEEQRRNSGRKHATPATEDCCLKLLKNVVVTKAAGTDQISGKCKKDGARI